MINLQNEQIVMLNKAAPFLPNRPNLATLFRWRTRGCRGVILETVLLGGRRATSVEALDRFFAAVTAAADGPQGRVQTPKRRQLEIERAEQRANELGV